MWVLCVCVYERVTCTYNCVCVHRVFMYVISSCTRISMCGVCTCMSMFGPRESHE